MKLFKFKYLSKMLLLVGMIVFLSSCQRGYGCPYDFSVVADFISNIFG